MAAILSRLKTSARKFGSNSGELVFRKRVVVVVVTTNDEDPEPPLESRILVIEEVIPLVVRMSEISERERGAGESNSRE